AFNSFLETAEPGIREDVAGTIGRPARWIHFAVRLHDWIMIADLAATLAQITYQFLATIQLRACWLIAIEISNQADPERDVIQIIAMNLTAVDLPAPAIADFDLAIAGRCPVSDHEMIGESILHPPKMPMVIVERRCVSLARSAIVHDD